MNFYVEYYVSEFPARKLEIDQTLKHNISLDFLQCIFVLTNKQHMTECEKIVGDNKKVKIIEINKDRLTFQNVFDLVSEDSINIVANNDILLTESFGNLYLNDNDFFAISRYENSNNRCPFRYQEADSQDIWVTKGKIRITGADFYFGILGCDNAIVFLAQQNGYRVSNPAFSFKAIHNHNSEIRTLSSDNSMRLKLPYAKVKAIYAKTKKTTIQ